jgi:hypothetical protein
MLGGGAVLLSAAWETVSVTIVVSVSVSTAVVSVAAVPMTAVTTEEMTVAAGTAGSGVMGCGCELDAVCGTAETILGTTVIALLVVEVVGVWDDSVLDAGASA